jgi:hypothetical protein
MTIVRYARGLAPFMGFFIILVLSSGHLATMAAAQVDDRESESVVTAYSKSYSDINADITRPVTINSENHLYYPGEQVAVSGSVWSEIIESVQALNVIKTEIKDGRGNVVAVSDAELDRENGKYTTMLKLPDNSGSGTYIIESRIELEADALGIVEAVTSATLQSSMRIAVAKPQSHLVIVDNQTFAVTYASNSALDGFEFKEQEKAVSIFAEGSTGTTGVLEISIPKALLRGEMAVFIDDNLATKEQVLLKSDSENETTFEINYSHSIHQIEVTGTSVTPEFPFAALAAAAAIGSALLLVSRTSLRSMLQQI